MFRKLLKVAAIAVATSLFAFTASSSAKDLLSACGKDIDTYCSKVTPGEGRMMACLYAHGDQIADQCVANIQDTALKFETAVDMIQFGFEQCSVDIDKFCAETEPGQGRMYRCIKKNYSSLSSDCTSALKLLESRFKPSEEMTKK